MTDLKQVIFVKCDLKTFSKGAIAVQAVHAAVKAIEVYKNDADTIQYLANIDSMTTLLLKFTENDTKNIKGYLDKNHAYIEWIENPEQILTAIALRPCVIACELDNFLRQYKLY